MNRTRTLIILGIFMLSLAVLAALELQTEDSLVSEGQMVTGSVAKNMEPPQSTEEPLSALSEADRLTASETDRLAASVFQDMPESAPAKSGVLVPLDNGTLRGSAEPNTVATSQLSSPRPEEGLPSFSSPAGEPSVPPAVPAEPAPKKQAAQEEARKASQPASSSKAAKPVKDAPAVVAPSGKKQPAAKDAEEDAGSEASQKRKPLVLTAGAPAKLEEGQKAITQSRMTMTQDIVFRLTAAAPIKTKTLLLTNPDRYVVDLQGDWGVQFPLIPRNLLLKEVRIGKQKEATRLVFELLKKPKEASVKQINAKTIEIELR